MLTARQNFLETIHGGSPDRFVNQYEFLANQIHPMFVHRNDPKFGEENVVNDWGVTFSWRADQPGAFPVHTPDKIVCKDVEEWRSCVTAPPVKFSEAEWEPFIASAESVDRTEQYVCAVMAPGLSEMITHLCGMTEAMCAFYESPEAVQDLIKYLTEYELGVAEDVCAHMKPDALLHHDDWGSSLSTFLAPEVFAEFFLDAYKEIYRFYREKGVEIIVHHSDSYAATLVPYMIEMGIDVWQGVLKHNDIPELISRYGGQISFMGGIENSVVDRRDWTQEAIDAEVRAVCQECGSKYFIPCSTSGAPGSAFPGVYEAISAAIDTCSKEMFA